MPMLFIILAFVGWCYFCNKYNRKELIKKRRDLLNNLSKDIHFIDRIYFADELRKTDFELFGGCKSNNSYRRCYLCDIRECPRHGSHSGYYKRLSGYGTEDIELYYADTPDDNPSDYRRSEIAPQPPTPWANQSKSSHNEIIFIPSGYKRSEPALQPPNPQIEIN